MNPSNTGRNLFRHFKYLIVAACFVLSAGVIIAQDNPAYILYNAKGKKIKYGKMMQQLGDKDILLFGEYHNNPIAHWLQLEVTTQLAEQRQLVLGAEMFEQDNIPRRYASLVARAGLEALDTLGALQKSWIAPLPIAYDSSLPGYKNMVAMMGGHGGSNLPKAQAIKDATMAHFILQYYQTGSLFIHFNGSYHSDFYEGILWYLKRQKPELKYATITTVSQKDIRRLEAEHLGRADYIICVPENMTTTY